MTPPTTGFEALSGEVLEQARVADQLRTAVLAAQQAISALTSARESIRRLKMPDQSRAMLEETIRGIEAELYKLRQ